MSELGRAGRSDWRFLFELRGELTASTGRASPRSNSVSYLICMISELFTFPSRMSILKRVLVSSRFHGRFALSQTWDFRIKRHKINFTFKLSGATFLVSGDWMVSDSLERKELCVQRKWKSSARCRLKAFVKFFRIVYSINEHISFQWSREFLLKIWKINRMIFHFIQIQIWSQPQSL